MKENKQVRQQYSDERNFYVQGKQLLITLLSTDVRWKISFTSLACLFITAQHYNHGWIDKSIKSNQ
ncbi:CLUMA_CG000957, isoform A [Clunio marinus]|uniref:CLUMA_CG000957, isoform A n=1 Tax=Clunio marinus TaxID=568069 RepID=A0A1J1HIB9_9DIPT|nr:CLUMA_CG000957, isoform A [Clunio marinus]